MRITIIEIERNGQSLGKFTLSAVRTNLKFGVLKSNDWAWHVGLSDWVTVDELLNNHGNHRLMESKKSQKNAYSRKNLRRLLVVLVIVVLLAGGVLTNEFIANKRKIELEAKEAALPAVVFRDPFAPDSIV